jgi:hypothetical protein
MNQAFPLFGTLTERSCGGARVSTLCDTLVLGCHRVLKSRVLRSNASVNACMYAYFYWYTQLLAQDCRKGCNPNKYG